MHHLSTGQRWMRPPDQIPIVVCARVITQREIRVGSRKWPSQKTLMNLYYY